MQRMSSSGRIGAAPAKAEAAATCCGHSAPHARDSRTKQIPLGTTHNLYITAPTGLRGAAAAHLHVVQDHPAAHIQPLAHGPWCRVPGQCVGDGQATQVELNARGAALDGWQRVQGAESGPWVWV